MKVIYLSLLMALVASSSVLWADDAKKKDEPSTTKSIEPKTEDLPVAPVPSIETTAPENTSKESHYLLEFGFTLGMPAVPININLGYWGSKRLPLLVRLSGMSYGTKSHGIQADIGWPFDREGNFRQFVAASFVASHWQTGDSSRSTIYDQTGVGPSYGLNWYGFSLLAGLTVGEWRVQDSFYSTDKKYPVGLLFQIGYTHIW